MMGKYVSHANLLQETFCLSVVCIFRDYYNPVTQICVRMSFEHTSISKISVEHNNKCDKIANAFAPPSSIAVPYNGAGDLESVSWGRGAWDWMVQ